MRAEEDLLSLHRGIYHPGSLITMDSSIVPSPNADPSKITRREFLDGLGKEKSDLFRAIFMTLFMVSTTTAQGTILAIILYLIGII